LKWLKLAINQYPPKMILPTKKAMSIWGVPPVGNIGWMNRGAMRVLAYAPLMA
jgi:hypothetical protein